MREVYVTAGYVLKNRPYKEDSSEVVLFTEKLGKIHAVAQAARRTGATFAAATQVGAHGTYTVIKGKQVWRIRGAHNIVVMPQTYTKPVRQAYLRILALLARFLPYEERQSALFKKLEVLDYKKSDIATVEASYVLILLAALGYAQQEDVHITDTALMIAAINRGISAAQL